LITTKFPVISTDKSDHLRSDGRPYEHRQYNDYDEHSTLAYFLCRTLETSAMGRRSPDLASSPAGRIMCPGGAAFRGGGDLVNRVVERLQLHCRPAPLCHLPDPRFSELVAQWVGQRSLAGDSDSFYTFSQQVAEPYTYPNGQCAYDQSQSAPIFPNNWSGAQP
jgi:hypothetical protein